MKFDPELFQQGENAYLNGRRQQQEQALANFDRLRAIGDTEGMKNASLKAQGRGGLLNQLFKVGNTPYGSEDQGGAAQGMAPQGITGMNVGGMVKNNMNATDIYDNLQKTFEGEVRGAKSNEERARLFRSYNEKVRQADNIFGWKNADGLNVKDYLVSSGGGGGKKKEWHIRDAKGNYVNTVQIPEYLSDEKSIDQYLSKNHPNAYSKAGSGYTLDVAGGGGTQLMDQKTKQLYDMTEQAQLDKAKENAQGVLNTTPYLRNLFGINEKDKRILAENNMDQYGNKLNGLPPVEIANKQQEEKKKTIAVNGRTIIKNW